MDDRKELLSNYFFTVSNVFKAVETILGISPASAGRMSVFVSLARFPNDSTYFEDSSYLAAFSPSGTSICVLIAAIASA